MGLFNFSNDTQNQISSDVEEINRIIRNITSIVDPQPQPLPLNIKNKVVTMITSIEPQIKRINNNLGKLSERQMMTTRVSAVTGEKISINQWLFSFSMITNQIAQELEC